MTCVIDARVIESGNSHECACFYRDIEMRLRPQSPDDFKNPAAASPAAHSFYIGAIARIFAGNDNSRNDRAVRNCPVPLRRIWLCFVIGHVPTSLLAVAVLWIEVDAPNLSCDRGEVLR